MPVLRILSGVATRLYPELWEAYSQFGPQRTKTNYPEIYPSNAFIGNFCGELLRENGCIHSF
ncbi:MAG: hypothetical protein ACLR56_12715 [Oscillospiraceae bacterium]